MTRTQVVDRVDAKQRLNLEKAQKMACMSRLLRALIILGTMLSLGVIYRAMTTQMVLEQSPEEAVIAYHKAVMVANDAESAIGLLCRNGFEHHKHNTESQVKFWSGRSVLKKPYDFRVVQATKLEEVEKGANPTWKVWISFRYGYEYEGREQDLVSDGSGGGTYVEKEQSRYCVAPWAGG